MFSWYKYLIVSLVFSPLGFWSGNLFLIAPFPDLYLLVPFCFMKLMLCIHVPGISFYKNVFFCSSQISTLVAMATYSFQRLIMWKTENVLFLHSHWRFCRNVYLLFIYVLYYFCPSTLIRRRGISIVGQLTKSVSPGFWFIRMFIVIYLFVLDDSLTS